MRIDSASTNGKDHAVHAAWHRHAIENEPRLRVLTLASCPFPANHGTPGSIREMAEAISQRGHDVHIVTYHIGEDIPINGPIVHRIPRLTRESQVVVGPTSRRPLYDLLMVFKSLQVIRRHRPHLIHAHGYEAALVAGLCRLATGLPIVYSGHNTMSDELPSYNFIRPKWLAVKLAKLLDRFVPRLANRCVPHSEPMHRFFEESGLGGRTDPVVNFGINLEAIEWTSGDAARERYQLNGPVVLYAGVMDHFQRLDLLLEAMLPVTRAMPTAKLLLVCTIPSDEHLARIRRQAEQLGIARHIVTTTPQDLAGVRECLAACDVAVVPRPAAPGFPIKLLNYMAAGKACVMFASSASGLVHGKHALLVPEDTSVALGESILELLGDHRLRDQLGHNAFHFVLDHHDRRLTAKRVCESYLRTLSAAGRRLPEELAEPRLVEPPRTAVEDFPAMPQSAVETAVFRIDETGALVALGSSASHAEV